MINVQQILRPDGFGLGLTLGEHFFSQGMRKGRFGIKPGWTLTQSIADATLTGLGLINAFAEGKPVSQTNSYAIGNNYSSIMAGIIYSSTDGVGTWTEAYRPSHATNGNGLVMDQKNRLLYVGTRYVGKHDGTANYTTGTLSVTNGDANVVGTGTTFVAGDVGKRIVINGVWYTIATFTDATHIALSVVYAGSTNGSIAYAIYRGWDDTWKDFGDVLTTATDILGIGVHEDWVLIPHNNVFGGLNISDDSFTASAFDFPTGYNARIARSGRNGVLLGANFNNRGIVALWDINQPRSIAPWIWLDGELQTIVQTNSGTWIVITSREILETNGYSTQFLARRPDQLPHANGFTVNPNAAIVIGDQLLIGNSKYLANRQRSQLEILNLPSLTWESATPGEQYGVEFGAILFSRKNNRIHVSHYSNQTAKKYISNFFATAPSQSLIMLEAGGGSNEKVAEAVKLQLAPDSEQTSTYTATFNVSVKIATLKTTLFGLGQTNAAGSGATKLRIDGTASTSNRARVGDMVQVLDGPNAGEIRHIASIANEGASNEEWTVGTAFTNTTGSGINLVIMPFEAVSTQTVTSLAELRELYFAVSNKLKAKKYLIMVLIEGVTTLVPEIVGADFIFDDLGAKR